MDIVCRNIYGMKQNFVIFKMYFKCWTIEPTFTKFEFFSKTKIAAAAILNIEKRCNFWTVRVITTISNSEVGLVMYHWTVVKNTWISG